MNYRCQEIVFGVCLLLLGSLLMYHTFDPAYAQMAGDLSLGPMFFPRLLLVIWLICATGITVLAVRKANVAREFLWGRVLAAFATLAFFALFFEYLGFFLIAVVTFFLLSRIIGFRRYALLGIISCAYVAFLYVLFKTVLQSYLPIGTVFGG